MWENFVRFLKEYDIHKISEFFRNFDWSNALHNPFTWLVGLPLLAFVVVKKQYGIVVLGVSAVLYVLLLQHSLPPSGESMPLDKLALFLIGSVVLIGSNFYYFFIRKE